MNPNHTIDFRYAPPVVWTSICRPDDPYKTLVREDGALLYGFHADTFESWYFERVIEFSIQTAHKPVRITQRTESARVPVVITAIEYPRATLELTTFGHRHSGDRRTDVVLWTIRAHDEVDEFLTGLHVDAYERHRVFVGRGDAPARAIFAADPAALPPPDRWAAATRLLVEDENQPGPGDLAFLSTPQKLKKAHTGGFRPGSGLSIEPAILRGGDSMSGAMILPLNHSQDTDLDYAWAQAALEAERAFWEGLRLPALAIQVPDPAVMDMLTACARNILQAREIENGLPVFKVGATVYRNLFVVDGHFMLETAQYLGYRDEAEAAIGTLLRRVRPNGAIAEMVFHTKETGISIATLVRQFELLGDNDGLRELWPTIQNGVAYLEGLRAAARQLPPDDPCYGLLPVAFGDGGVGGERGEYTTAVWILFGLKAAADAAQRLGSAEDAVCFGADFAGLLADFRAHAAGNMDRLPDGTPYLPMCFPGSGEHHWIPNYPGTPEPWHRLVAESATWALCQAIWPGEVFAPDDPLVQNLLHLLDLRDDEEGIPVSTGWLPYKAIWLYYASFAAHVWLYAGRPDKAVDYLYAFANHASHTRVWREEQSITATGNGQLFGDMPHNWASAEFIRLVRHLLVFERGEVLELLPGLPRAWLKPGAVVYLERTPTRFGPVTLRAEQVNATLTIDVQFDAHWPRRPVDIWLHLPGAGDIRVNGQLMTPTANGVVSLPHGERIQVTASIV
jgi:hypothetical protein